ncbi:hypothetical protein [Bacillus sp. Marseille-P3661]|uniref:hypothetical protein n=1 Tax=Bacillus sp. Marseille-P3661 TaxID=1936234 RepID=UPI0015E1985A|nr:hypothetical protein [Bacillus sp. Marseille-P3661]
MAKDNNEDNLFDQNKLKKGLKQTETLNPNIDPPEDTLMIIGGGDPNLSADAGKPLI